MRDVTRAMIIVGLDTHLKPYWVSVTTYDYDGKLEVKSVEVGPFDEAEDAFGEGLAAVVPELLRRRIWT